MTTDDDDEGDDDDDDDDDDNDDHAGNAGDDDNDDQPLSFTRAPRRCSSDEARLSHGSGRPALGYLGLLEALIYIIKGLGAASSTSH